MDFIKRGKDLNMLALTDMEAMTLSNILSQYNELSLKEDRQGNSSRRAVAKKIDKIIKEKM